MGRERSLDFGQDRRGERGFPHRTPQRVGKALHRSKGKSPAPHSQIAKQGWSTRRFRLWRRRRSGPGLFGGAGGLFSGTGADGFDYNHAGVGRRAGGDVERAAGIQGRGFCQSASRRKAGKTAGAGGIADASGEALPCVGRATKMPDVIYEMSRKKLGVTAVVNGEKLVGNHQRWGFAATAREARKRCDGPDGGRGDDARIRKRLWLRRICGDGFGFDGRKEDYVADGGGFGGKLQGIVHLHDLWTTELV